MNYDEREIDRLHKHIDRLNNTIAENSSWHCLIKKLIPNYKKYEDKAFVMVEKHGLLKAIKLARKVNNI